MKWGNYLFVTLFVIVCTVLFKLLGTTPQGAAICVGGAVLLAIEQLKDRIDEIEKRRSK